MKQSTCTKLDMYTTLINNNISRLSELINELPASEADELNDIISNKYPFVKSLNELAYDVQQWRKCIKSAIY